MAITYPLSTPTSIGIETIELRAVNAVATSQSPFTFKQQIVSHQGQMWQAAISIPSVRRDLAEDWNAFLLSLRGPIGTFLLGDPNSATPRGSALSFKKNLLTFTEQFDNAAWSKQRATVTTNASTAPDGNTTADKLVETTDTGLHAVFGFDIPASDTLTYSISVYAKAAERNFVRLRLGDAGFIDDLVVDLTDGSILNPAPNALVDSVGNGWFRISFSDSPSDGQTAISWSVQVMEDASSVDYTGDGTSGIYIWGAQLEEGSVATEYQPIANAYGPFVNGASQTGDELNIDGASPDEDAYLKAGDYIQLGSGSSSTLHKVLADVSTNSAGEATIDIWPSIRTAPADNATVTIENCKGVFRLAQNVSSWSINNASTYGISFEAVEVIK